MAFIRVRRGPRRGHLPLPHIVSASHLAARSEFDGGEPRISWIPTARAPYSELIVFPVSCCLTSFLSSFLPSFLSVFRRTKRFEFPFSLQQPTGSFVKRGRDLSRRVEEILPAAGREGNGWRRATGTQTYRSFVLKGAENFYFAFVRPVHTGRTYRERLIEDSGDPCRP